MAAKQKKIDPETFLPLTPTVFDILLSLVEGELHGYAIMQDVAERTRGSVTLLPGTLYRALTRLLESGLVEISDDRPDPELDDERRRYYKLTQLGGDVIEAEARRLARQVKAARDKKLMQDPKKA